MGQMSSPETSACYRHQGCVFGKDPCSFLPREERRHHSGCQSPPQGDRNVIHWVVGPLPVHTLGSDHSSRDIILPRRLGVVLFFVLFLEVLFMLRVRLVLGHFEVEWFLVSDVNIQKTRITKTRVLTS